MKKSPSSRFYRIFSAFALVCTFSLLGQSRGWAQTFTWQGTTSGWNTAGNWTPVGGPPNAGADTAVFANTGTTTVNPAAAPIGVLTYNANALAFTITTGTLTIDSGSSGSITLNGSANTETISSVIAGSHGEVISGTGTLDLAGANTFTGGLSIATTFVEISGGKTGGPSSLGGNTALSMSGGATLDNISSSTDTITMAVSVSVQTAFQNDTSATFGVNGGLGGSGTITINTGATSGSVGFGGTVTTDTFTGTIDDNGSLLGNTVGTAYTSGASGGLGLSALVMGNSGTFTAAQNQFIGSLAGSGSGSSVIIGAGKTLSIGGDNTNTSYAGVISSNNTAGVNGSSGNGALTKIGTGSLTLSNANTFGGATNISSGVLILSNALALQDSSLVTTGLSVSSGTYVSLSSVTTPTFGGISGTGNLATAIQNYSSVTALTLNPISNSYTGVIADGATGMTLTITGGTGIQTLGNANTYTGATRINGGTLTLTSSGSIANSPSINVASGATFNISAYTTYSLASGQTLSGGGTVNAVTSLNAVHTTSIASGSFLTPSAVTMAATKLTFNGNLSLAGTTKLTLYSGTTSYDSVAISGGGTLTYGGTLNVAISGSESSGTYTLFSGISSSTTSGDFSSSGVTVDGGTLSDSMSTGTWTGTGMGGESAIFYTTGTMDGDLILGADSAVPEPGTWALVVLGGIIGWFRIWMLQRDRPMEDSGVASSASLIDNT